MNILTSLWKYIFLVYMHTHTYSSIIYVYTCTYICTCIYKIKTALGDNLFPQAVDQRIFIPTQTTMIAFQSPFAIQYIAYFSITDFHSCWYCARYREQFIISYQACRSFSLVWTMSFGALPVLWLWQNIDRRVISYMTHILPIKIVITSHQVSLKVGKQKVGKILTKYCPLIYMQWTYFSWQQNHVGFRVMDCRPLWGTNLMTLCACSESSSLPKRHRSGKVQDSRFRKWEFHS